MRIHVRSLHSLMAVALLSWACGSSTEEVPEVVPGPAHARIESFSVEPGIVDAGDEVTVSWRTENASGIRLTRNDATLDVGDAGALEGSVKVVVSEASTFVLEAMGATDVVAKESRAVRIAAVPRPSIVSFTAEPASVTKGGEATLRWRTEGAERIRIANGAGTHLELGDASPAEGSVTTPALDASTTFTLTAEREGAASSQVSIEIEVLVPDELRIVAFTAEPATVEEGGSSRLAWVTEKADEVRLFAGAEEIDLRGQPASAGAVEVFPVGASTYRLVAARGEQTTEATVVVRVAGYPLATLSASPSPIALGDSATLSWTTEDAASVRIVDSFGESLGDDLEPAGSRVVQPLVSTTFTVTAAGVSGKESHATATVEVRPEVISFAIVDGEPAGVGDPVELAWTTGAATSVEISNLDGRTLTFAGPEAAEGRATLPVGGEGQFEIVARSGRLESRQTLQLEAMAGPAIGEFRAERDVVSLRDGFATVRLAWSGVNRADSLELTGSTVGTIDLGARSVFADFIDVDVAQNTSFTLLARNGAGQATATVDVRAVPLPQVNSVTAWPDFVGPGEDVQLAWQTSGATHVEIKANGVVIAGAHPVSGDTVFPVSLATTFEVTAFNDALDVATGAASVAVGAPQVLSFTASSYNAWTGSAVTFDWETRGAGTLRLTRGGTTLHSTAVRADVVSGSFTSPPLTAGEHDFVLEIENAAGARRTSTIRLRVGSGPTIDSFTVTPALLLTG
ncbi:MAG TPA: hypothetical protein VGD74_08975, partial [Vulgatibacter sp.]